MTDQTNQKVKALKIIAKKDGFRRCGYEFGSEPTIIPVGELESDQVKVLKAEKMLVVSETTVAAE